MLSVSYAGKNAYSAGKTSGVLRGGASGANCNRCYVLAHCGGGVARLTEIKANSASQQSWSWGLAELGNIESKKILNGPDRNLSEKTENLGYIFST